ncbi:type II secretion system F family protein [Phenylobacterium sp.]|jgi:tight adherence protein B|uniref:type II secretion system F family protein n=1 Tax=Phenylobacterium sp. TaxID=1871053 RepID=UPI00378369BA
MIGALLVGATVFLTVLALAAVAPAAQGSARIARRARALAGPGAGKAAPAGLSLRRASESGLDRLAQRFLPRPAALKARLEATGRPITIGAYGAACLGLALADAVIMLMAGLPIFSVLASALAAGLVLPYMAVGMLAGRRRARFLKIYAEAIGLIVRGLRAGLPVTETIGVVGQEIADPVGEEFRRIAQQVRLGEAMETVMWRTARRLDLPEFNFLVISLSVQRETGGNLAETLSNLEQILRRRQQMKLKVKAMSSEATASALIIGALPFVMAVLMWFVSPDYLQTLFVTPLGKLMLACGLASLFTGGFVMRQMVRFEI